MVEPNELLEFRQRWKREITTPHPQDTVSGPATPNSQSANAASKNVGDKIHSDSDSTELSLTVPNANLSQTKPPKRSWDGVDSIREQTNVLQPFLIAENLLKGESGLASLASASQTNRRDRLSNSKHSRSSSTLLQSASAGGSGSHTGREVKSKVYLTSGEQCAKLRKTDPSEDRTFLDLFLNDLNEINEIPFFELDVPREVAIRIFHFLDTVQLCRCSQVSKAWKSLADDELLWCRISHTVGLDTRITTTEKQGWKEAVRQHVIREKSLQQNWRNRVGSVEELQYVIGGVLCASSSHKHLIAAGYNSCQLKVWDRRELDTWTLQPSTTALVLDEAQDTGLVSNYVSTIGLNDHCIAAGYNQGFVDIWSYGGQTSPIHSFSCQCPIRSLYCSKTEPLVAVAYGNSVRIEGQQSDKNNWKCIGVTEFSANVSRLKLLSHPGCGSDIVVAVLSDSVYVYPACNGQSHMTAIYDVIGHPISCIDGDGSDLAVGISAFDDLSNVYKLKLYNLATARESITFRGHQWRITAINMADNPGSSFVTGCADKMVRVYDRRLAEPVICLSGHSSALTTVQMDDWKVVSGSQDGLLCVWDQRMVARLWDVHNRHPVQHQKYEDNLLVWSNVPHEKSPETDGLDNMVHRRYRGSLHVYNFAVTHDTVLVPDICQSTYDEPDMYNYNIRLTVPYDAV